MSGYDFQRGLSHGFSAGVPSQNFYLSSVVLAGLGYVHMVHAVVGEFVAGAVGDGMTVDEPHYAGLGMSSYAATEASPFALFYCACFRLSHEDWGLTWFSFLIRFFGGPGKNNSVIN